MSLSGAEKELLDREDERGCLADNPCRADRRAGGTPPRRC
jgi:hypothetical protein